MLLLSSIFVLLIFFAKFYPAQIELKVGFSMNMQKISISQHILMKVAIVFTFFLRIILLHCFLFHIFQNEYIFLVPFLQILASSCPRLQAINLSYCVKVSSDGMKHLIDLCPDIHTWHLSNMNVSSKSLKMMV